MSDIRDVFRDSLYHTDQPEKIEEGRKGRNRAKQRKAKKASKSKSDKVKSPTSANRAAGVQSGTDPIGKYGKTHIASPKDKDRDPKRRRRQKDFDESVAMDEDLAADDLVNELVTDFEEEANVKFNEETVNLLKEAFMTGFLSSSDECNGQNCKAVYKNSALKPDGEVWNKNLKEKFSRFVYNEQKKRSE